MPRQATRHHRHGIERYSTAWPTRAHSKGTARQPHHAMVYLMPSVLKGCHGLMVGHIPVATLTFSRACVAQSTASCCMSSDMSAFLTTALRSAILNRIVSCFWRSLEPTKGKQKHAHQFTEQDEDRTGQDRGRGGAGAGTRNATTKVPVYKCLGVRERHAVRVRAEGSVP